jgi:hypothetical protein
MNEATQKRLDYLAKVAPLKVAYAQSIKSSYRDGKAVPKIGELKQEKTFEEQAQDKNLQNNLFLENMKSIMQGKEAQALLTQLDDEAKLFVNRNFTDIKKELAGRTIDARFFGPFLRRYIDRFTSTGNTGIITPLTPDILENRLVRLYDALGRRADARSANSVRQTITALEPYFNRLIAEYNSVANEIIMSLTSAIERNDVRTAQKILEIVQRMEAKGDTSQADLIERVKEIQRITGELEERVYTRSDLQPTLTPEELMDLGQLGIANLVYGQQTNKTLDNIILLMFGPNEQEASKYYRLPKQDKISFIRRNLDPEKGFLPIKDEVVLPPVEIARGAKIRDRVEYAVIYFLDREILNERIEQSVNLKEGLEAFFAGKLKRDYRGATKSEISYFVYSFYKYLLPEEALVDPRSISAFFKAMQQDGMPIPPSDFVKELRSANLKVVPVGSGSFAKQVDDFFEEGKRKQAEIKAERETAQERAGIKIKNFVVGKYKKSKENDERIREEALEWVDRTLKSIDDQLGGYGDDEPVLPTSATRESVTQMMLEVYQMKVDQTYLPQGDPARQYYEERANQTFARALALLGQMPPKKTVDKASSKIQALIRGYKARKQAPPRETIVYKPPGEGGAPSPSVVEIRTPALSLDLSVEDNRRILDDWVPNYYTMLDRIQGRRDPDEILPGSNSSSNDLRALLNSAYNLYKQAIDAVEQGLPDYTVQANFVGGNFRLQDLATQVEKISKATGGQEERKGNGVHSRRHGKGSKVIYGRGIAYDDDVNYNQFGRYILHRPSLKYNIINIKYPSMSPVRNIAKKTVSDDFVKIMKDLVDIGELNENRLNKLSKTEKEYFYDICKKSRVDDLIGLDVPEDEDDDWQRFQIVKGLVIAGNDDQQLIKELRGFLIKYSNGRRIPKNEALELLYLLNSLV